MNVSTLSALSRVSGVQACFGQSLDEHVPARRPTANYACEEMLLLVLFLYAFRKPLSSEALKATSTAAKQQ